MKHKRKAIIISAWLLVGLIADQVILHGFIKDGALLGNRIAPYDPPIFYGNQKRAFADIQAVVAGESDKPHPFDRQLGWCPPRGTSVGDKTYDEWGARVSPEPIALQPTPGLKRIAALGCSFTLAHEVEDQQAWPHVLDLAEPSIEVLNFGVNAYGLDQAWLRYRRDARPAKPDEVWLAWLPSASLRLASTYRPALGHWSGPLLFKPRFRMGDGDLELLPNPASSLADVEHLLTSQPDFLEATRESDHWVQRSPSAYAPMGSSWLHSSGFGRIALSLAESGARDPEDWLLDQESEVHKLALGIIIAFRDQVEADGAVFRLVILPGREDLQYRQEHGAGYWESVVTKLDSADVDVLDLTDACLAAGMLQEDAAWQKGGHYSPASNAVVADALQASL